jgi:hypothetical protein
MIQLSETPRDLPFLVALIAGWQRASFPQKFRPHPAQVARIEKTLMRAHGAGTACRVRRSCRHGLLATAGQDAPRKPSRNPRTAGSSCEQLAGT